MLADPLARGQYQCWRRTVTNAGLTLITGLVVIVESLEYRTGFLLLVTKVNVIGQFIFELPRFLLENLLAVSNTHGTVGIYISITPSQAACDKIVA